MLHRSAPIALQGRFEVQGKPHERMAFFGPSFTRAGRRPAPQTPAVIPADGPEAGPADSGRHSRGRVGDKPRRLRPSFPRSLSPARTGE